MQQKKKISLLRVCCHYTQNLLWYFIKAPFAYSTAKNLISMIWTSLWEKRNQSSPTRILFVSKLHVFIVGVLISWKLIFQVLPKMFNQIKVEPFQHLKSSIIQQYFGFPDDMFWIFSLLKDNATMPFSIKLQAELGFVFRSTTVEACYNFKLILVRRPGPFHKMHS